MADNPEHVDMDLIDLDGSNNSGEESSSDEINSRFAARDLSRDTGIVSSKLQFPIERNDEKNSDSNRQSRVPTRDLPFDDTIENNSNCSYETANSRVHVEANTFVPTGDHIANVGTSDPGSASNEDNPSCLSPIRRSEEKLPGRGYTPTCQSHYGSLSVSRSSNARNEKAQIEGTRSRPSNNIVKSSVSDRKRIHRRRRSSTDDSSDTRARYKRRHQRSRKSSRHRHRRSPPNSSRRPYTRESRSNSSMSPTMRFGNDDPYAVKAFKDYGAPDCRLAFKKRDPESRNVDIEVERRVRAKIEQRVAEELEKRKAQIHAEIRSRIAQEQTRMYAELKSELETWRNEERRKMLQQEDEQKRRREELEISIAENNRKIEEQHRRIAEEHMRLLDEQRKLIEQKERIEAEQKRRATEEQAMILGRRGTRPKLSFQLGQK